MERRTFLKGLVAAAGAGAVAPKALPGLLRAIPATTTPVPSIYKMVATIPISRELLEDWEPVEWTIQRELHHNWHRAHGY